MDISKSSSFNPVFKRKKKKILIIESSSSPKVNEVTQTDLKINNEQNIILDTMKDNISPRLNESYIALMETLYDIMMKQGEPFRARAYKKAQETIMMYPEDIHTPEQLRGQPNIGSTIMNKLIEYQETGTLKIIEREKNNPVNILTDVYGIGPKKAQELVNKGITSIETLRENQNMLNDVQKIGLRYYEDIVKRIPRAEIDKYYDMFNNIFNELHSANSKFEIVGSYRRGALHSGDIDVIITGKTNEIFKEFVNLLIKNNIIREVLSRGPTKSLTICKIPSSSSYRRVDFLFTTEEEYPFAVLYFTGSKMFNTVMRGYALKQGYSMNEHGIYHVINKKKTDKINHLFRDEQDIFRFLGLAFKKPQERIDGRSVIPESYHEQVIPNIDNSPVKNKTIKKRVKKHPTKKLIIIEEDQIPDATELPIPLLPVQDIKKPFNVKTATKHFKQNGIKVLAEFSEEQLASIIRKANKDYYNQVPILTDNEFDVVKEYVQDKYPDNKVNFEIGASVEKNKVKLPYEMWSMDKIKPDTNALPNWMNKYKGPYVLSAKLDGVSGMYTTEGNEPKLYTRGNGKIGQDVSHLIKFLNLPNDKGIVIRGEFIISKKIFQDKYKDKFANPRNMVSGVINQKSVSPIIKDIDFVSYEVIKPSMIPSKQMNFLSNITGQNVISEFTNKLSNDILSDKLLQWRKNYVYEIDGIIVTDDKIYPRKSGNPEHSFAFKMVLSDQIAEAKVIDVIWTPSKDGYLKPRVQIEPIHLGGVKIEFATGFNAAFIKQNHIGVGALIEIIRSGDVIPYIKNVIVPADVPLMPSTPYKWNTTGIDIMLENFESNEIVVSKNITGFFRGIGVEGLSSGNINRLILSGYDSVPKILNMTLDDFLSINGFQQKMASKIYQGIQDKLNAASLVTIMSATNIFGRGFSDKKLELIISEIPDILTSNDPDDIKINKIATIKGMALKTAELFVEKIPNFISFIKDSNLQSKIDDATSINQPVNYDPTHPLYGKTIVLTGFRDTNILMKIKEVGAKHGSSVSKNTNLVIVKDENGKDTGKAADAAKLNIPIITKNEFITLYM